MLVVCFIVGILLSCGGGDRRRQSVRRKPYSTEPSDEGASSEYSLGTGFQRGTSKCLLYPSSGCEWKFVRPAWRPHGSHMIQLLIFLLTTSDVSYIHDKNFDFSYNIFLILFDTPISQIHLTLGARGNFDVCASGHVFCYFRLSCPQSGAPPKKVIWNVNTRGLREGN